MNVPHRSRCDPSADKSELGISIIELIISMGIIGLLAGMGAQLYGTALGRARVTRAVADLRTIERLLSLEESQGTLPATLADIGWIKADPWDQAYRYMNFALEDPKKAAKDDGKPKNARRDKFLKPLNSTYDLYSTGQDGETKPSLNHKTSWDDVLRAADGVFVGLGSEF